MSDGDPIRSAADTVALSSPADRTPLALAVAPPLFVAADHPLALLSPTLNNPDFALALSQEASEDATIGAVVLSRSRLKDIRLSSSRSRPAPVAWRLYQAHAGGDDAVWAVLREYLTNGSLKARGRDRALQLLTGYTIAACLESTDAGIAVLSEIVRRMRGAERSERDGSIFTLLINIAAHASFVQRISWPSVEEVARRVFSDVVEAMHGRQDDDVMWERALRCFLILLKASHEPPSDDISSKCLAALALHLGDLTHTDVDHVLITEGLCPRLRNTRDEFPTSLRLNRRILEEIGGLETICALFAETASPSARRSLFRILHDVAVLRSLEEVPVEEGEILNDHIATFRSLLESYEMFDLFVHAFRIGPQRSFVMDTVRILLLNPLSNDIQLCTAPPPTADDDAFRERKEEAADGSVLDDSLTHSLTITKHVASVRAAVRLLNKPLCLRTLRELNALATHHATTLAHRETMRHAREWRILRDAERAVCALRFSRGISKEVLDTTLDVLRTGADDISSGGRCTLRGVMRFAELVIALLTTRAPFNSGIQDHDPDGIPRRLLRGRIVVTRAVLDRADTGMFLRLLRASKQKIPSRRVSEVRQCLVEVVGAMRDRTELLREFTDDDDSNVAYRAAEIVGRGVDSGSFSASSPAMARTAENRSPM